MYKSMGVIVIALVISGCASLSKNECLNADWQIIGFEDGSRGSALDRIGQHRKACARVNIIPDMALYETGHKKGAREYCTRARGYAEGAKGAAYYGICPEDLAGAFLRGYGDGQERYALDKSLNEINSEIASINSRLSEIEADVAWHEREIISGESGSGSRGEHLASLRDLQRETTELLVTLHQTQEQKYFLEQDYQSLLNHHKSLGY